MNGKIIKEVLYDGFKSIEYGIYSVPKDAGEFSLDFSEPITIRLSFKQANIAAKELKKKIDDNFKLVIIKKTLKAIAYEGTERIKKEDKKK